MSNLEDVCQQQIKLRQERLEYCNLVAVAQDQIALMQALERSNRRKGKKELKNNDDDMGKELGDVLLKNHQKSVDFSIQSIKKHSELVARKENGLEFWMYLLELEKILAECIENCNGMLDIGRAVKLINN